MKAKKLSPGLGSRHGKAGLLYLQAEHAARALLALSPSGFSTGGIEKACRAVSAEGSQHRRAFYRL